MKNRQRTRRISLNENHNKHMASGSNIDVQIFTNTKEPNQVNLNSSSKLLATTETSTSAEAAHPVSPPAAQIAAPPQQQQQLIRPPTIMTGAFPFHAKLRKSKSTPSLSQPMAEDLPTCHRPSTHPGKSATEAKKTLQHEQFSCITSNTPPTTPESLRFGCAHYKRRAMFVVSVNIKFE